MEFFACTTLPEALKIITGQAAITALAAETVEIATALGRIAARNITAGADLPAFDRSTVDGFAVNSADTFGANEGTPVLLSVAGEVLMGRPAGLQLQPGQAAAIPTGGMLPKGADAVVMVEYTEQPDANSLLVAKPLAPGENVVVKGEDFAAGTVILRRGIKITSQNIGVLAACGVKRLSVVKQPVVGIISTGDEIVDIGQTVDSGQVRDINSYTLAAMLQEAGCGICRFGIVPDRFEALKFTVSEAVAVCNLVLISGGSSVGVRDHTVKVIESFEASGVLLHGVSVKPGKPTIFGMIGNVPVFGLPGHPAAAATICEQVVMPAVALLTGAEHRQERYRLPARMARNIASAPGRDDFIRVRLLRKGAEYWAEPILGKSGLISTMLLADGMVHISSEKSGLYKEEWVEVELIK